MSYSEVKPVGLALQSSHCSDTGWPLVCFWGAVSDGSPLQITSLVLFLFPSPLPLSQGTCVPGVDVDNTRNLHCFVSHTLFTGEQSPPIPSQSLLGSRGSPGRWRNCSPPLPCLPPFSTFWLSGSCQLLGGGGAALSGASASGRCFLPSGIAPHSCRRSTRSGSTSLRKPRASCSPPGNERPRGA